MAVVLAYRIAIALVPPGAAALRKVETSDPTQPLRISEDLMRRLGLRDETDAGLSAALSDLNGYSVVVTTFSGSFEVRRVQLNWTISDTALLDEDVRVCTFHLIKHSGGTPTDTWASGDFEAARDNLLAWWTSMKVFYLPSTKLASIKFYREGPSVVPPQPPVYSHEPTPIAGTSGSSTMFPPQISVSITEKTSVRRSWGRIYLPAMASSAADPGGTIQLHNAVGRLPSAAADKIADHADTLYEAMRADSLMPVVYRRALPAREDADGDELPARSASALSVDDLQVDDLFDVIRSRRYDKPSLRVQRAITT